MFFGAGDHILRCEVRDVPGFEPRQVCCGRNSNTRLHVSENGFRHTECVGYLLGHGISSCLEEVRRVSDAR